MPDVPSVGSLLAAAERAVFRDLQHRGPPFADRTWRWIRNAELAAVPVAAGLAWSAGRRGLAGRLLGAWLAAEVGGKAMKHLVDRPRPDARMPDADVRGGAGSGSAMPSDHAAVATALATASTPDLPLGGRLVGATAQLWTAYARIHTGLHRPGDVLVGAGLGWVAGRVVRRLSRR